jgi:hypothetical protein
MKDEKVGSETVHTLQHPKGQSFIRTVARWPWRSVPAKKCVTTKQPNERLSKILGAQGSDRSVSCLITPTAMTAVE